MTQAVKIEISSSYPMHIEVDVSRFGEIFAGLPDDSQVAVLRAMAEHMRPYRLQWDYISIELEKPENLEIRNELRAVLFPPEAAQ